MNWLDYLIAFGTPLAFFIGIMIVISIFDKFGDFWDWCMDEWWHIPLLILGFGAIAGIVAGFILWIWWAMLIITICILIVGGIIGGLIYWLNTRNDWMYYEFDYQSASVELLKEVCQARMIKGWSKATKKELIEKLQAYDEKHGIDFDDENDVKEEFDGEEIIEEPKTKKYTTTKGNIPTIKLSDIAGLDEAKKALEERVILPLKHKDVYEKYGKSTGGGILLYGLPGTGKTMFAQAVATELDAKFFSVKCSDIQSKWHGEAEKNVKELFAQAKKCPKAVIFFDEFDSLGRRRTEENQDGANTVQEILTQMQGVEKNTNMLLVIGATNCPWALDGALLRPGRFNEKIYIPLPDKNAILFMLKKGLKTCLLEKEIDLSIIADKLIGCNGADITEFCEKVKMLLIRKEIAKDSELIITQRDIDGVLDKTKTSVLPRDIESMKKFVESN